MIKFKFKKKGDSYKIKLKIGRKKWCNSFAKLSDVIKEWLS